MGDILFLAHRCPYPPDRGDRIRSWHILKALAAERALHLVAFADQEAVPEPLAAICASVRLVPHRANKAGAVLSALFRNEPASVLYFANKAMKSAVADALSHSAIDTIYAFSGQMAQYCPAERKGRRFFMDFVDVDSAKFEELGRAACPMIKRAYQWEAAKLKAFETRVAERADISLFVSEPEAALFRTRTGLGPDTVLALSNGVDLDYFNPQSARRDKSGPQPLIVFTGQMDYPPNEDAVCHFATQILPDLRAEWPGIGFAIVGRAPTPSVVALGRLPGVDVTGEVPDTRPWLARADVVVAPLRIARGIQNKVLEAMAMARPIVATSMAAEGIAVTHGKELLIADGEGAQIAAIKSVLRNRDVAHALGYQARLCVENHYGWGAKLKGLSSLIDGQLEDGSRA